MKAPVPKAEWKPIGIKGLEENALMAVQHQQSQLVVAGPGAGKTELLAQRACYLLQTHLCPSPRRILAISFKRDSAQNLKERVEKRCGKELSRRFDSMTFDAFSKSLLDRFMPGLPDEFRPRWGYKVRLSFQVYKDVAESIDLGFAARQSTNSLNSLVTGQSLPLSKKPGYNPRAGEMWSILLRGSTNSILTFPMISRLAELIIYQNNSLRAFLQKTYAYVFLDEFQDTTGLQYDLLKTCFYQSDSVLTAVGDDRQRIMGWAGALDDSFDRFKSDFSATEVALKMNYRSAPLLVEVQKVISATLLGKELEPQARPGWKPEDGLAEIWQFKDHHEEVRRIVTEIKKAIVDESIDPRDVCILVKQQLPVYADIIIDALNNVGISARNEDKYQNYLTEEIVKYLVNLLYWVLNDKSLVESQWVIDFYTKINNATSDKELRRAEYEITLHKRGFQKRVRAFTKDSEWLNLIREMLGLINRKFLEAYCPDYRNEEFLEELVKFVTQEFLVWLGIHQNPVHALDCVIGKNSVPVMTVHKSKGLEYHTVIFVGLEDNAFWSFANQPYEDKCTFFVAMSRAKQRVVFTFSNSRPDRNGYVRSQTNTSIMSLYDALRKSGLVKES
jgi:superfamily I DNA/RNA helicase